MKQFTFDEFINYNNPCFNCNRKTQFKIGVDRRDKDKIFLHPIIGNEWIGLSLDEYGNLYLKVDRKTNRIEISNKSEFLKYQENNGLYLISYCQCHTEISTFRLSFDLIKNIVYPVEWHREELTIENGNDYYRLITYAFNQNQETVINSSHSNIKLPFAYPLYKFKTKEVILNKLQTLLTFG